MGGMISADDAGEGAGSGGVESLGHAAGELGFAACDDGVAHRFGHEDGVGGSAMAVFMRTPSAPSSMATAASEAVPTPASTIMGTSVMRFAEDAQICGILNAEAGADRRGQRHDRGGAGVDEFAGGDQVVIGIRENDEAFFDENFGWLDKLFGVREERLFVADDFELDPVGETDFAGETRGADGFVGGIAGGGVGKNEDFFAIDVIEERFLGLVRKIDAADGDSDHVGAGSGVGTQPFPGSCGICRCQR